MFYLRFTLACLRPGFAIGNVFTDLPLMYYLVLYRPLLAEFFFLKLGFNHGIISHFKEVNRYSYEGGCLISLSAIKQPI